MERSLENLTVEQIKIIFENRKYINDYVYWGGTPQGHNFWSKFYYGLENVEEGEAILKDLLYRKTQPKEITWV